MAQDGRSSMAKKLSALWLDARSFKKRFFTAGAAMLGFCYTFLFFGPFEMIAFGGNAMSYGWQDIWWMLALFALTALVTGTALLSLLRGKIFNWTVNAVFCLTVCGYLQAALMNGSLGSLNGDSMDWHRMGASMLGNLGIWLLVFFAAGVLLYLARKLWRKAVIYISLLLVVMQIASTFSVMLTGGRGSDSVQNYGLTADGMYAYSQKDNIFVFVLDRLDYDYIDEVLKKDPAFFDDLEGFTGYTNAISAYARTQPALNHLLTGSETAYTCAAEEFYAESWNDGGRDLLGGMKQAGYSVELYTKLTYLFSDLAYAQERVDNVMSTQTLSATAVLPKLLRLSAYRYSPIAMKPFFWADTNYYNEDVFADGGNAYQFDDAGYAPGFVTATADRDSGSFKLYHFYGSHSPYTMDENGKTSEESTSALAQTMGSFRNLKAAFGRMKELGIYEDATIIITADHGSAVSDRKPLQKATRIGLFYKPSGSADTPLTWSAAPVCTDNISATLAKAAGIGDLTPYGTPLEEIGEEDTVERYYYKSVTAEGSYGEKEVYVYTVTGDAADFSNWTVKEVFRDLPDENSFY